MDANVVAVECVLVCGGISGPHIVNVQDVKGRENERKWHRCRECGRGLWLERSMI